MPQTPHVERHSTGSEVVGDAVIGMSDGLPVSPLANTLGFVSLPPRYWLFLAVMLLGYPILTEVVKTWFIRRFGE